MPIAYPRSRYGVRRSLEPGNSAKTATIEMTPRTNNTNMSDILHALEALILQRPGCRLRGDLFWLWPGGIMGRLVVYRLSAESQAFRGLFRLQQATAR